MARIFAQETPQNPIIPYLKSLETHYNVRFSYVLEDLEHEKYLDLAQEFSTLEEVLNHLQKNTSLIFNRIDDRYISIVSKKISQENIKICGILIDPSTQTPLDGANIQLKNKSYNTISDSQGMFKIPLKYADEYLSISHIGYETLEFRFLKKDEKCIEIALNPLISELEMVSISNILTQGIFKNIDGTIRLSLENFGLLPGQIENDVLQIAQSLPGVESVDETISNINIRGGSHDENLILWNDIPVYQSGHFFGLISAFNPDITKEVIIHKNGTNARYGEGVSGVIAMHSKDNISEDINAGLGINLLNASAFIEIPISSKFGIQLAARKSINGLWESPVYRNYAKRIFQDSKITNLHASTADLKIASEEHFNFYDISGVILWNLSKKDKIQANFLVIDNTLDFTETMTNISLSKTSSLDQSSKLGGISWQRIWNKNRHTNLSAYSSSYLLDAINKDIFTNQEQIQTNEILDTGVKLNVSLQLSPNLDLVSGYQFSEKGIANTQDVNLPRFRSYEKFVLRGHSLFTGLHYKSKLRKTFFKVGIRGNYFDRFDKILIEPRFNFHQKLAKGFAIEVLGELKSQTSTQRIDFESDFLGVERRRWIFADMEKTPIIQSKQTSAGLVYKNNHLFFNLMGFYKQVNNINIANEGLQNQFQFTNAIGSYQVKGAELMINQKISDLTFWLSYVYSKNMYDFKDLESSQFPNNLDMRHAATIAGSYHIDGFKFALGWTWHSGKPYTIPLEENEIITQGAISKVNYDMPNGENLPNYFRTDISAEYLWQLNTGLKAKINFALLNIFDTKNTINIRYSIARDADNKAFINKIKEKSLGITPNFSFQLLF